ncbi:4'-phosphopantetheinyl transferase family protein [Winogradskyella schleiferi]|uniref:4'-phosphopantetheinyl transferase family protein n=1 Tax=Winogradskyella schleiferi TaxID=2686078 RepID=UPI0015BFFDD2|nr:4'-phosphopantetheinyl transferase superfamily protein [Winogradskyella schleiferi]
MKNQTRASVHLKPNMVHLWTINVEVKDDTYHKYYTLLSEYEKERADRFKFYKDKRCYVVARGVLRLLSSTYLKTEAIDIEFDYEQYGKPKFKQITNLNFNVSHSGDIAIIGFVYDHSIGVDIEKIKDDFNTFEIATNFFSKKEIEALQKTPKLQQHLAFYRCWTRKEAFIKAKGNGLSFPLDTFSVTLDSDLKAELIETQWNLSEKNQWQLTSFIPDTNYIAALIVANQTERLDYFTWDHSDYN